VTGTLLFVHSPVTGPTTWTDTAKIMQQNGFRCVVPNLTGVTAAGAPYYPALATTAGAAVGGGPDPVVIIAHSAAGALLPAIAEFVGERTRAAVFVDAMLPQPGRSWFDTAPPGAEAQLRGLAVDGCLPPYGEWFPPGALEELVPDPAVRHRLATESPRLPVAYFEEPAPPIRFADSVSCAFVRLGAPFDRAAEKAGRMGWWVARRQWDHLRMLSDPAGVADLISQAISASQPR
jgi:alpha/beta hydrolase family protein